MHASSSNQSRPHAEDDDRARRPSLPVRTPSSDVETTWQNGADGGEFASSVKLPAHRRTKHPSSQTHSTEDTTPRRKDRKSNAKLDIEADKRKGTHIGKQKREKKTLKVVASDYSRGASTDTASNTNTNGATKPPTVNDTGKDTKERVSHVSSENMQMSGQKHSGAVAAGLSTLKVVEILDPMLESITLTTMNQSRVRDIDMDTHQQGDTYVASFFVCPWGNVRSIAAYLDRCLSHVPPNPDGAPPMTPLVISKVESKGYSDDNLEGIMETSDGIMVMRSFPGKGSRSQACSPTKRSASMFSQVGQPNAIAASQTIDLTKQTALMSETLLARATFAPNDWHEELDMRQITGQSNTISEPQSSVTNTNTSGIRRTAPRPPETQPGAFAVEGPDPSASVRARRPENQASIVRANAVDDAELVVYASSVSPDERVKMRRRVIGVGIFALLVIIGLSIGLTFKSAASKPPMTPVSGPPSPTEPPISTDPRCLLPPEEQDVFAQCECFNTTEQLSLTDEEKQVYLELRSFLLNSSAIDEKYGIDSCDPQNQCIVWRANYERRDEKDRATNLTLNDKDALVQSYSLCSAYLGLAGWNWERNDSWIETENFCDWYGVTCSFLSRVTSVELPSNGLDGTLTSELRHMSYLRYLDMSRNPAMKGIIPLGLSQVTSLHVLDLSSTNMNGTVPSEIEELQLLDHLVLSNSSFSGTIPVSIANLPRMKELHLDRNSFVGTIGTEFGNLTNLALLSFANNQITGTMPTELSRLKYLEGIDLSGTSLAGPFPLLLGDLSYLITTFAHDTQLTGFIPESFCESDKEDRAIITLDCLGNLVPERNCSCCDDITFCIEDLPPSLQALV